MTATPTVARPPEPVLAAGEIQGNVLPGFATRHQELLFYSITDVRAAADWLGALPVTTLADVTAAHGAGAEPGAGGRPWINVALSYAGLAALVPDAGRLTDLPLKQGMRRRSALLGDPAVGEAEGHPANWLVGGRPDDHDVLLILGDADPARLDAYARRLRAHPPAGLRLTFAQRGGLLADPLTDREPFGFCDNISQPGLRGRLPAGTLLTPRADPADPDHGAPGQKLLWPGEFVFGYPRQDSLDATAAGPVEHGGPPWARDGSLLVLRRLRQEVTAFRMFLATAAAELRRRHGRRLAIGPELLAAKLMGRWPSGVPLMHAPDADHPTAGHDPSIRNHFGYLGDADGLACPRAAHIRRAYPRDAAASGLTEATVETHRLLRRSIPFGDPRHTPGDSGLVFLAYQTSIERQFEFITRAWLNVLDLHDTGDGQDPIAGQRFGAHGDRRRLFTIPVPGVDGVDRIPLTVPQDWVVPTGGGYFFVPSTTTLAGVIGQGGDVRSRRTTR